MATAGDSKAVAYVCGHLTRTLETIARVSGELGAMATSVHITNNLNVLQESPAFMQVQASLLRALGPFPDARAAVVAALRDLDATSAPARPSAAANGPLLELEANHVG
jgi:hypothetical protein